MCREATADVTWRLLRACVWVAAQGESEQVIGAMESRLASEGRRRSLLLGTQKALEWE